MKFYVYKYLVLVCFCVGTAFSRPVRQSTIQIQNFSNFIQEVEAECRELDVSLAKAARYGDAVFERGHPAFTSFPEYNDGLVMPDDNRAPEQTQLFYNRHRKRQALITDLSLAAGRFEYPAISLDPRGRYAPKPQRLTPDDWM